MGVLSAPLDELRELTVQLQEWLKENRLLDKVVDETCRGLFDTFKGSASEEFQEMIQRLIIAELEFILRYIDGFLNALIAIIDAIQEIIEALEAANPLNWF